MLGQIISIQVKPLQMKSVTIQIGINNTTQDLKLLIGQVSNYPPANQFRLIHSGKHLKLTDQLCHYSIKDQDYVMLVLKLGHICQNVCKNVGGRFFHPPPYLDDPEL